MYVCCCAVCLSQASLQASYKLSRSASARKEVCSHKHLSKGFYLLVSSWRVYITGYDVGEDGSDESDQKAANRRQKRRQTATEHVSVHGRQWSRHGRGGPQRRRRTTWARHNTTSPWRRVRHEADRQWRRHTDERSVALTSWGGWAGAATMYAYRERWCSKAWAGQMGVDPSSRCALANPISAFIIIVYFI